MLELPTETPSENTFDHVLNTITRLPLPVLIGVGVSGGIALIGIIFLFIVSSIALM